MNKVYTFIGGRKLAFALVLCLISTVFVFANNMTSAEWLEFQKWIFGIYAGGNVGEYVAGAFKKEK